MTESNTVKAYNYIFEAILSGTLPLGAPISENEISAALGTSRSPLREALNKLQGEGIVKHFPGKGTFVMQLTSSDVEEIFDLRILLETGALKSAIEHITLQELEEVEQRILKLNDNTPQEEWYHANRNFHRLIMSHCGNKRLQSFYEMLSKQVSIVYRVSSRVLDHIPTTRQQHLQMIDAIKKHDYISAKQILVEHLEQSKIRTIELFTYARGNRSY